MTTRTFVPWVQPVADQVRETRTQIARTARSLLPEHWSLPSPLEGWTHRDLLAHLAGDTDKNIQTVLSSVVARQPLDPALFAEVDAKNARDLAERSGRSVEELVAEIEHDRDAILDLLAQLQDEHAGLRQADFPLSLGEALPTFPEHDREHLSQLKTALDNVML